MLSMISMIILLLLNIVNTEAAMLVRCLMIPAVVMEPESVSEPEDAHLLPFHPAKLEVMIRLEV